MPTSTQIAPKKDVNKEVNIFNQNGFTTRYQ